MSIDLGTRVEMLAAETGWSQSFIRKLVREGKLDARKVGRTVIITRESVRALIDSSPRVGGKADGDAAA